MAAARPILALISLLLTGAGIVLTFFVVLSGAIQTTPINRVWFLQADVTNIPGAAPNPARWTYLALCGVVDGVNGNCRPTTAALPFNPPQNFGTTTGVAPGFIGTNHYYYLSRFMWAFFIIALFFAICAFFIGMLAFLSRIGAYLGGTFTGLAFFFQALTASLMTAWTVKGRNQFRSADQDARLGAYGYGFTWAPVLCYFIALVLFCAGGTASRKKEPTYQKRSYWGRKQSTRSRGSLIDSESQRGVVRTDYP